MEWELTSPQLCSYIYTDLQKFPTLLSILKPKFPNRDSLRVGYYNIYTSNKTLPTAVKSLRSSKLQAKLPDKDKKVPQHILL